MKEMIIEKNGAGQRLDKFLGKYMNRAPKSFLYKMLRKKNITLNGKKASGSELLSEGDRIKLFLSDDTIEKFSDRQIQYTKTQLDILFEDKHTIFINKPVGMLSQKAAPGDESLVEHLISYLVRSGQITKEELDIFRPSVCNRLDRNTSGIVAAGKSLEALQQLNDMFRNRTVTKYYLCLVHGCVTETRHIHGFLCKDKKTNRVQIFSKQHPHSDPIETEYEPLKSNGEVTLMNVHLITGKSHQIRAHLASEGHSIIGDYKYGDYQLNRPYKDRYGLSSQMLHSWRLCLPACSGSLEGLSGKEIVAPPPALFQTICRDRGVM